MARGNPQRYLVVDGTQPPEEIHAWLLTAPPGSGADGGGR